MLIRRKIYKKSKRLGVKAKKPRDQKINFECLPSFKHLTIHQLQHAGILGIVVRSRTLMRETGVRFPAGSDGF